MAAWDIDAAHSAVSALRLSGANVEVASRWLALWREGRPPPLERFEVAPSHAPAIAVFRIRRGEALDCVRAGDYYRLAIGFDLAGQSVLAITNNVAREDRLDWCWRIVEGAATVSYRAFKTARGVVHAQGMSLPLSDCAQDGARFFVMHTNWRPEGSDWFEGTVSGDMQTPFKSAMKSFAPAATREALPERAGADFF